MTFLERPDVGDSVRIKSYDEDKDLVHRVDAVMLRRVSVFCRRVWFHKGTVASTTDEVTCIACLGEEPLSKP